MKPAVVKVAAEQIEQIHRALLALKDSSDIATTNQFEAFRVACSGEIIIGYTSGKIVSNGSHAAAAVQNAVGAIGSDTRWSVVIGSDEAGKGEWLGPMTVAAVALTPDQTTMMRALGVMDSKIMSIARITELSRTVRRYALKVESLLISPEKFNSQIDEFRREGKNLNDMLAWAHAKVISEVYESVKKHDEQIKIVIDQFARVKTEVRLRAKIDLGDVELVQRPKAEDEIAVAAASIIAREAREAWIDWACQKFGDDLRELSISEAHSHAKRDAFTKLTYLKSELEKKQ